MSDFQGPAHLVAAERERVGRSASTSAAIGQDRRPKGGSKDYDTGKKINSRKRHILTDTDRRLLAIHVRGDDVQNRDSGKGVLKRLRARYPFVKRAFADGGYLVDSAKDKTHIVLQIVRRTLIAKGFEVLAKRWVVERTLA